jgi:hypothetical protein
MGSENLDQRDLQGRDFTVQEDASEIELDLETNVNVRSVYRRLKKLACLLGS